MVLHVLFKFATDKISSHFITCNDQAYLLNTPPISPPHLVTFIGQVCDLLYPPTPWAINSQFLCMHCYSMEVTLPYINLNPFIWHLDPPLQLFSLSFVTMAPLYSKKKKNTIFWSFVREARSSSNLSKINLCDPNIF